MSPKSALPRGYTIENRISSWIAKMFGSHFSGVHMVWGAINEMTTLQGYRRLWKLAGHPVPERLLRPIAQEEAIHFNFLQAGSPYSTGRFRLYAKAFTIGYVLVTRGTGPEATKGN
ncbi:MAG: hypothetical protein ACR2IB_10485 [Pyrinomonadaceae bacterium]